MIKYLKLFLFVLLLSPALITFCQAPKISIEKVNFGNDITKGYVFSICQNTSKYMMFGTWEGMVLNDGYENFFFKPDPENPSSLSNNCVTVIHESKNKTFVGTNGGGLICLITEYNNHKLSKEFRKLDIKLPYTHFRTFKTDNENPNTISTNNITSICEDDYGTIWIGTYGGGLNSLTVDSIGNYTLQRHIIEGGNYSSNNIKSLYKERLGNIIVGTMGAGIYSFNPSTKKNAKIALKKIGSNNPNLVPKNINEITQDNIGNIWVATNEGLFLLKSSLSPQSINQIEIVPINTQPSNSKLINQAIETVLFDKDGVIWIGGNFGLAKINYLKSQITETVSYNNYFGNDFRTSSSTIQSLYKDYNDVLWIGSYNGVHKMNLTPKQFNYFSSANNQLIDNNINALIIDRQNNIWAGCESGVLSSIAQNNLYKHYFVKSGKISPVSADKASQLRQFLQTQQIVNNPLEMSSQTGDFINTVLEDNEQNIWIGGVGLYKFNPKTQSTKYFAPNPYDDYSVKSWMIWNIIQTVNGDFWLATGSGIERYDSKSQKFTLISPDSLNPLSLSSNQVWTVFEDNNNNLWFGTNNGVNILTASKIKQFISGGKPEFIKILNNPQDSLSISSNEIVSIYEDQQSNIWIGTLGGGVNIIQHKNLDLNAQKITIKTLKEKDGLAGNNICKIIGDHKKSVWISTTKGISKINIEDFTCKNFYSFDGLQANEFRKGAGFISPDNQIVFGGMNGFNQFHADSISLNPIAPTTKITNFKIFNQSIIPNQPYEGDIILTQGIEQMPQITLNPGQAVFSFEFIALHSQDPSRIKYAYMLEGFEKEWNYTTSLDREARYSNIPFGKYVFKLKAANPDGIWNNSNETAIKITIRPPVWLRWYAFVFYVIIFLLILYFIRKITISQERLKTNFELAKLESLRKEEMIHKTNELNQVKINFFTNISHELRTPLTLIMGPIENLLRKIKENDNAKEQLDIIDRNAKHLLRLVNQIMDFRKLEIEGIQPTFVAIDINTYMDKLTSAFKHLAAQRNIHFNVKTDQTIPSVMLDIDMTEKIIYNLLSNAFKFTKENGTIHLTIKFKNDHQQTFPEGYVAITISDDGIGIAEDKLNLVFDRYYQVENPHTFKREGSGIGLALAKEFVELHHGTISVSSNKAEGTKFVVCFPIGNLNAQKSDNKPVILDNSGVKQDIYTPDINEQPESNTKTIDFTKEDDDTPLVLIVEDNNDLRAYIHTTLSEKYHVIEAPNGAIGIEKAIRFIPDIIISDIMMPDIDGFELCQTLKNDEHTSHIPIVMLTAMATEDAKIKCLELGADDYLIKPFNSSELEARMKNLIESRNKLRQMFSHKFIQADDDIITFSSDKNFIDKALALIDKHITETDFGVEEMSVELGLSRAQLYRKIKGLTGQTVSEFIRTIKLKKACVLLKEGEFNINEIVYKIGFGSQSYFTKCFKQQFGISPTDYTHQ